jgi:hypothetical protein
MRADPPQPETTTQGASTHSLRNLWRRSRALGPRAICRVGATGAPGAELLLPAGE